MEGIQQACPKTRDVDLVRSRLLNRGGIAFLDGREETPRAEGHRLFVANVPMSPMEMDASIKLPRRDFPLFTLGQGEGMIETATGITKQA